MNTMAILREYVGVEKLKSVTVSAFQRWPVQANKYSIQNFLSALQISKMSPERSRLLEIANRALDWIHDPASDHGKTHHTVFAPNVHIPHPHPGTSGDIAGLVELIQHSHKHSKDHQKNVHFTAVDEKEHRVIFYLQYTGKHSGYVSSLTLAN